MSTLYELNDIVTICYRRGTERLLTSTRQHNCEKSELLFEPGSEVPGVPTRKGVANKNSVLNDIKTSLQKDTA